MGNPEGGEGPLETVGGKWGTIEFVAPDFLEGARDAVNTFFSILINILNILLAVLEVLKVFIGAFLDPIIALIRTLLDLIRQILNDLRNAGLYIHGDFSIIKGPDFKELRGGFQAYEQRMITRLVDRRDPNRPNISNFSTVIAVFLYVGVDISNIQRLIRLIQGILQLFNRKFPKANILGQVAGVRATFGLEGASILTFGKGIRQPFKRRPGQPFDTPFNAMNLSWQMAPVPGNFLTNFAQFAPKAFIVEVSTVRDGLPLFFDTQVDMSKMTLSQQPGKIKTGFMLNQNNEQAFLTGGADQLNIASNINFNVTVKDGELEPGASRVYTAKSLADQAPIDLTQLQEGEGKDAKYYLQRSFYVPATTSMFYPGRGYGKTILFKDLPLDADWTLKADGTVERGKDVQPQSYYVSVRAVTHAVKSIDDRRWFIDSFSIEGDPAPTTRIGVPNTEVTQGDIGEASFPYEASFPGESTQDYLTCVQAALVLLVLARADLDVLIGEGGALYNFPPTDDMKDADDVSISDNWNNFVPKARKRTNLEVKGQVLLPSLTGRRKTAKFYERNRADPAKFRRRLFNVSVTMANELLETNNPPLSLQRAVVERCATLLNFTWGDALIPLPDLGLFGEDSDLNPATQTILESLLSASPTVGIGLNTYSMGVDKDKQSNKVRRDVNISPDQLNPGPHFFTKTNSKGRTKSSVEMAPIFYVRPSTKPLEVTYCEFIRNLIPDEVYAEAQFALQVAAGPIQRPQEQGWIAFRLFPQGIPAIDRFFDQLLALLSAIQSALQGLADLINKYIEMLQSRILELQQFLNRINAIIQQLLNLFISIPPTSGLVVVSSGTDGVLSSLTLAENKPFDPPETYGGGVVLLAGGLPTIALELFQALFSSKD